MERIIRDRRLTEEEAAKYRKIREEIAAELPELIARHQERMAARGGSAEEQADESDAG